jgi:hypothetical protein
VLDALSSFADMMKLGPYSDRQVERYEEGDLLVSTALVTDLKPPYQYETAISHPAYDNGEIIPVDCYETIEEARVGHEKWLKLMLENPPECLRYGSKCKLGDIMNNVDEMIYKRQP